jgi:hypothetical protein
MPIANNNTFKKFYFFVVTPTLVSVVVVELSEGVS